MIRYTTGNLLEAETQALVNTVNTKGVAGKGIALQFKERFKMNHKAYVDACKSGWLEPGKLLITTEHTMEGDKLVVNFPTKTEWFKNSTYSYIEKGLATLAKEIEERGIKSIAIPPLGCGNGGLDWAKVRPMIEKHLGQLQAEVLVYEPSDAVKEVLRKEQREPAKLTPARAMLLAALFDYERGGERANLMVANKVAYLLQLSGEALRLNFKPHHYGPYTPQILHVLYYLNGTYLKGLEQKSADPFDELELNYDRYTDLKKYIDSTLEPQQRERLEGLTRFIDGFRSAHAMELLASVAYLKTQEGTSSVERMVERMAEWSDRKGDMAKPRTVSIVLEHLVQHGSRLHLS